MKTKRPVTPQNIRDYVWDKTIGAGNDQYWTAQDLAEAHTRFERALTAKEVELLCREWNSCLQQMEYP